MTDGKTYELKPVAPFNYQQYCQQILDFPKWMTEYVQKTKINGSVGWLAQFKDYRFVRSETSWKDGVENRRRYHIELNNVLKVNSNECLRQVVNNIVVKFGGIKAPYELDQMPSLRKALNILSNEANRYQWTNGDLQGLQGFSPNRIASISKIYEMLDPHKWAIYDARVATALVCLVHYYWKQKGKTINPNCLCFPVPQRKKPNWKRCYPSEFQRLYRYRHDQASLAFIYSSWLFRQVAEILRSNSKYGIPPTMGNPENYSPLDPNWQVYHIEMALWMLGDKEF